MICHGGIKRKAMNETSTAREDLSARRALTGCILTLLIIWTLLGNFTVCAVIFRYRHLQAKVTHIFIVSLALSDLLVAVLVMPWKAVAEVAGFWPFGAFCETWVACDIMCSTASILNLCVISVDRYWAISSPFRYERNMNKRVASVMIGVTWTVSVVISFVPVHLNWHRAEIADLTGAGERSGSNLTLAGTEMNCDTSLSRTYAISSSLISFYIPVAIMIVTYTRIYRIAHMQIRRISSLERAAEHAQNCRSNAIENFPRAFSELGGNSRLPPTHTFSQSHRALGVSIRKETKVLKTLSIIMGVFVFCWFPFFVFNCALPFCPGPEAPGARRGLYCVSEKTFDLFVWLGWSNSSLNPVIYALNADFREAFLRLLGCRGGECCRRTASVAAETAMASYEPGSPKQGGSQGAAACRVTHRGSQESGNTMVTLFYHRNSASFPVGETEDHCKDHLMTNTDRLTHIPIGLLYE